MARAADAVFRMVVIPAIGNDIGHTKRAVAQNRGGHLAPGHKGFNHQGFGHVAGKLRRAIGAFMHNVNANRRAFVIGFHHIGRLHRMARLHRGSGHQQAFGHRQAHAAIHRLAARLVHCQRRGQNAGMRVRNAQPFQQALHAAIFAPTAMQRVKGDIGFGMCQLRGQIIASVNLDDLIPFAPQCGGTFLAG